MRFFLNNLCKYVDYYLVIKITASKALKLGNETCA